MHRSSAGSMLSRVAVLGWATAIALAVGGGVSLAGSGPSDHQRIKDLERRVTDLEKNVQVQDDTTGADIKKLQGQLHTQEKQIAALESRGATGGGSGGGGGNSEPTVVKVVSHKTLAKNSAVETNAVCPKDYQVMGGGYIQGAKNGEVVYAAPFQEPAPSYSMKIFEQPGFFAGNQDATTSVVAYCAKIGEPVVFGDTIPTSAGSKSK